MGGSAVTLPPKEMIKKEERNDPSNESGGK